MKGAVRTTLLAGLGVLSLLGCNPDYQTVRLDAASNPPSAVNVRGNRVEMPAGVAIVVNTHLVSNTREEYPGNGELELYSTNLEVFRVYPRPNDEQFVLVGIAPGTACMDVVVDGRLEDCIDVTVTGDAT